MEDSLWAGLTDSHAGMPMGMTAENLADKVMLFPHRKKCGTAWYGTVWYGAVRCGAVRCGAVRCDAARRGAMRRGARLASVAMWNEGAGWDRRTHLLLALVV